MNTFLVAGIIALSGGNEAPPKPISLNFSQTDVSQIFRAIGMRTGTNIVYSGPEKLPVSLHLAAPNAEDAIRGTASAAGLAYRRVGKLYVVAKPEALRLALEPYAKTGRIKVPLGTGDVAKNLQEALPHAMVKAQESEILITGIPDDLKAAQELIDSQVLTSNTGGRALEVLNLSAAPAAKVVEVLGTLYPTVKCTVLSDPTKQGGTVALSGKPQDVADAKARALQLDGSTPAQSSQAVVETYDVKYASARVLVEFLKETTPEIQVFVAPPSYIPENLNGGYVIGAGGGGGGGNGGGGGGGGNGGGGGDTMTQYGIPADTKNAADTKKDYAADRSKRIILKGRRADIDNALTMLARVDLRPKQIRIDVRVADVSPQMQDRLGIRWDFGQTRVLEDASRVNPTGSPVRDPFSVGRLARTPLNFLAIFDAEAIRTDSKILASPHVQVLDNDQAHVFIGDALSFPVQTAGPLGTPITQIFNFDIGIVLQVRPRVNADGNITMHLKPIVSTITGFINGLPQRSTREAQTSVMVKDGETVTIGGLIREDDSKVVTEVPILSKLPLVGELFRSTRRDKRRSNILVTITPRIIDADEPAAVVAPMTNPVNNGGKN